MARATEETSLDPGGQLPQHQPPVNTYVSSKDPLRYDPMLGWYTAATLSSLLVLFLVCVALEKIKGKILEQCDGNMHARTTSSAALTSSACTAKPCIVITERADVTDVHTTVVTAAGEKQTLSDLSQYNSSNNTEQRRETSALLVKSSSSSAERSGDNYVYMTLDSTMVSPDTTSTGCGFDAASYPAIQLTYDSCGRRPEVVATTESSAVMKSGATLADGYARSCDSPLYDSAPRCCEALPKTCCEGVNKTMLPSRGRECTVPGWGRVCAEERKDNFKRRPDFLNEQRDSTEEEKYSLGDRWYCSQDGERQCVETDVGEDDSHMLRPDLSSDYGASSSPPDLPELSSSMEFVQVHRQLTH